MKKGEVKGGDGGNRSQVQDEQRTRSYGRPVHPNLQQQNPLWSMWVSDWQAFGGGGWGGGVKKPRKYRQNTLAV